MAGQNVWKWRLIDCVPELRRLLICYDETLAGAEINEIVYVLKDYEDKTESMIVAVYSHEFFGFKAPVKLVFDGGAFPHKITEAEIITAIGNGAYERHKERIGAVTVLMREYCTFHPDVAFTSEGCIRCEMEAGKI